MKNLFGFLLIVSAFCFLHACPIYGQNTVTTGNDTEQKPGINLTVSPVFMNLMGKPGTKITTRFKVINNNAFEEQLKIELIKFVVDARGDRVLPAEPTTEDTYFSWISFSQNTFSASPKKPVELRMDIDIPPDAGLGYYYGISVMREGEDLIGGKTLISGAPTIPVLLEVDSPFAKKEAVITSFKTDKLIYEYLPVNFELNVRNTGNIHLMMFGDIFIDQIGKKEIGVIQINPTRRNLLPSSTRTFRVEWRDGFITREPRRENGGFLQDKNGRILSETRVHWDKISKFRIGRYTATAIAVYNDGTADVPLEASVTFWVIPWKLLLVALIVAIILLIGLKSILYSFLGNR
jgi:hypothetical protein